MRIETDPRRNDDEASGSILSDNYPIYLQESMVCLDGLELFRCQRYPIATQEHIAMPADVYSGYCQEVDQLTLRIQISLLKLRELEKAHAFIPTQTYREFKQIKASAVDLLDQAEHFVDAMYRSQAK